MKGSGSPEGSILETGYVNPFRGNRSFQTELITRLRKGTLDEDLGSWGISEDLGVERYQSRCHIMIVNQKIVG